MHTFLDFFVTPSRQSFKPETSWFLALNFPPSSHLFPVWAARLYRERWWKTRNRSEVNTYFATNLRNSPARKVGFPLSHDDQVGRRRSSSLGSACVSLLVFTLTWTWTWLSSRGGEIDDNHSWPSGRGWTLKWWGSFFLSLEINFFRIDCGGDGELDWKAKFCRPLQTRLGVGIFWRVVLEVKCFGVEIINMWIGLEHKVTTEAVIVCKRKHKRCCLNQSNHDE